MTKTINPDVAALVDQGRVEDAQVSDIQPAAEVLSKL